MVFYDSNCWGGDVRTQSVKNVNNTFGTDLDFEQTVLHDERYASRMLGEGFDLNTLCGTDRLKYR